MFAPTNHTDGTVVTWTWTHTHTHTRRNFENFLISLGYIKSLFQTLVVWLHPCLTLQKLHRQTRSSCYFLDTETPSVQSVNLALTWSFMPCVLYSYASGNPYRKLGRTQLTLASWFIACKILATTNKHISISELVVGVFGSHWDCGQKDPTGCLWSRFLFWRRIPSLLNNYPSPELTKVDCWTMPQFSSGHSKFRSCYVAGGGKNVVSPSPLVALQNKVKAHFCF